jgi:hypothetical protein
MTPELKAQYDARKRQIEERYRNNLAALDSEFSEKAAAEGAGEKLNQLIASRLKDKPGLEYGAAFSEIQTEYPNLVRAYEVELRS